MEAEEGGYIGIHIGDSCRYMAETNTTLQSNYIPKVSIKRMDKECIM